MMKKSVVLSFLLSIYLTLSVGSYAQKTSTFIRGKVSSGQNMDTITLIVHGLFGFGLSAQNNVSYKSVKITTDGHFNFQLPDISVPVYFSLWTSGKLDTTFNLLNDPAILPEALLEPGDNINIVADNTGLHFSGKGSNKFKWLTENIPIIQAKRQQIDTRFPDFPQPWLADAYYDTIIQYQLSTLEKYKRTISLTAYEMLKADIIGYELMNVYKWLGRNNFYAFKPELRAATLLWYQKHLYKYPIISNTPELFAASKFYGSFLYFKTIADEKYLSIIAGETPTLPLTGLFNPIIRAHKGFLRDKVLTVWLYQMIGSSEINDTMLTDALKIIETPFYRKEVTKMQDTYSKGMPVADASFQDRYGKTVRLSDFKGKVVFIDFWFTGCTGCVSVAKTLPAVEAAFHGNPDVVFISLSIDFNKDKWLKSIDPIGVNSQTTYGYTHYTTPSTVYLYTEGKGASHSFIKQYVPTNSYPHLLLIDKEQRIFSSNPPRPDKGDGNQQLIELIQSALN